MPKNDDVIVIEGEVLQVLPGMKCIVKILGTTGTKDYTVHAHLSGKMRKNFIRIIPGDKVRVEVSMYDPTKGRITFRETNTANTTF